jgi:hypothetical protein
MNEIPPGSALERYLAKGRWRTWVFRLPDGGFQVVRFPIPFLIGLVLVLVGTLLLLAAGVWE